ncbi:gluconokinase [Macrococcus hajekii]|uniref:Gluconokinase n=1 Tax=Macrococcus hajekii TaxID=198482 RepID=A0A4V3BDV0_9STAP|nr:gluconokinase [Macrococcus hajekii]TDM01574.1 gluconokinase [Macrococcus hajekii]GGB01131.1 gluconate kinase [Macrococcus hajekii]
MHMIGVDIGTTSTKAVIYAVDGSVQATHYVEYPLLTEGDRAEQNPDEIFEAVVSCIRNVTDRVSHDVAFISFSSAMHSLILMDEHHARLTNSITWADNRSQAYAKQLNSSEEGHDIYQRTGTPIHPMSPLTKIMWFRNEESDLFNRTAKFIGIKEYIFYQFFERYIVDYSIASATGLFNIHEMQFDEMILNKLGMERQQLSEVTDTTTVLKGIKPEIADKLGISTDTPVVIGASDGVLSNLGVDAYKPGEVAVTIGTSGAIRTVVDQPRLDREGRLFCYALTRDKWVIGGPVNNGGVVLRWIRDEFAASEIETAKRLGLDSYDVLMRIAELVPPASDGLIFHPYLTGERAPLWNADVRGSYIGLTLSHKKEHMIRAALEGVLYNLYSVFIALNVLMDEPVTELKATGGFSRSALWRQMMADIFDENLIVPESYESSCLGAVVLGQYALDLQPDFTHVTEWIGTAHEHSPQSKNVAIYREILPLYFDIAQSLTEQYTRIANFQRRVN